MVTIRRDPDCGSSRDARAIISEAGVEPTVIEYLETPPLHRSPIRPSPSSERPPICAWVTAAFRHTSIANARYVAAQQSDCRPNRRFVIAPQT